MQSLEINDLPMPERGCGDRKPGGLYVAHVGGSSGTPLHEFLIDPPLELPDGLNLSDVGMQAVPMNMGGETVHHFFDVVGQEYYPYVSDFLAEMRHFVRQTGVAVSRRIPLTPDVLEKIVPGRSRHFLVHRRAKIQNWEDFVDSLNWLCPTHKDCHTLDSLDSCEALIPHCLGLAWAAISGDPLDNANATRLVVRHMPSFSYYGMTPPEGVTPVFVPAFFAAFPITRLHLIADENTESNLEEIVENAQEGLNVEVWRG